MNPAATNGAAPTRSVDELEARVRDLEGRVRLYEVVLATSPVSAHVVPGDRNRAEDEAHEVVASGRLLTALIDTLDEAVVVVSDGRVAFANAQIRDFFPGLGDPQTLIGRPVAEVQRGFSEGMADPAAFLEAAEQIVTNGAIVRRRFVETADGRILEQHFLPIPAGGRVSRRMWVYRDVTAQLNLERRQKRLLEMERATRRSVEDQNEQLRELDDLKTAFVATVSHELRTPLSALHSYIDLLLDPDGEVLSDGQRHLAEAVKRGSLRLARLVDDLLVLAQLQTGSLPVEETVIDVLGAVEDAIEDVRLVAPAEVSIASALVPGPAIGTDRVRLTQIVLNLLGNAAKFAGSEVCCAAHPAGPNWVIEIVDDGPGIAPDELERIFEPFYRGRPGGRTRQGTGLGLPISVQLADLLGGHLTVSNNVSSPGVIARLTVPIDPQGVARAAV